jgi:hypothetical protein
MSVESSTSSSSSSESSTCSSSSSESSGGDYIYQTGLYYGIHYDIDQEDNIREALKSHQKFKQLVTDNEVKVNKYTLLMNNNSDISGESTLGLIFVDQMSIMGDEMDSSNECYLRLEPHRMLKLERIHKHGAELVTDVHDVIVKYFKKKGIFTHDCIYLGWQAITCTWFEGDDNTSSSTSSQ